MVSSDGDEYAKARKRLGLTQIELQELSGVSRRVIQKIEANQQSVAPSSRRKLSIALGMLPSEEELSIDQGKDAFWHLPGNLFRHISSFAKQKNIDAARCTRIQEAENTVERMRQNWKRHLSQVCDLQQNSRLQKIDRLLDKRCEEYVDRYVRIWHGLPASLMCSVVKGQRTGASIVLPVSDQAYDEFVTGKRPFMDIKRNDIVPGSQNLIFDSMVEFLDAPKASWYDITNSLSSTVFYQSVALSGNVTANDFRVASFEASPVNARRLKSVGFLRNGFRTAEYQFPIYEFSQCPKSGIVGSEEADDAQALSVFLADQLKSKMDQSNSIDLQVRIRRRLVLSALAIYQRMIHKSAPARQAA